MKRKSTSLLLAIAMLLGMLPSVAIPAAAAGSETESRKAIAEGADNIRGYQKDDDKYDYIYYGVRDGEAVKWRVLDDQTSMGTDDGLFLLLDGVIPDVYWIDYNPKDMANGGRYYYADIEQMTNLDYFHNLWGNSTARVWCRAFTEQITQQTTGVGENEINRQKVMWRQSYENNKADFDKNYQTFTQQEKNAILLTKTSGTQGKTEYRSTDYFGYYSLMGYDLKGDYVFFLSASEATDPEYGMDRASNRYVKGNTAKWFLRSWDYSPITNKYEREAPKYDSQIGVIGYDRDAELGRMNLYYFNYDASEVRVGYYYTEYGVSYKSSARPAMNLGKKSIALTSPADGSGKNAFGPVADYTGSEWKLTLQTNDSLSDVSLSGTTLAAGTPITVKASASENYDTITATLTDSSGTVVGYGALDENGTVTQPEGLPDGKYTLTIRAEQWNGAKKTDYATQPYTKEIYILNDHTHDGHTFTAITSESDLAKMTADSYGYLVDDVQVSADMIYSGHLCLNGHTVTGNLHVKDFALYEHDGGTGRVTGGIVLTEGTLALYGGTVEANGDGYAVAVESGAVSFPGKPDLKSNVADLYMKSEGRVDADGIAHPDEAYSVKMEGETGTGVLCKNWQVTDVPVAAYFVGIQGHSVVADGNTLRVTESTHTVPEHPACGASCKDEENHPVLTDWKALPEDETVLSGGNYYLDRNLTLGATLEITGDVNLCLNGHTLSLSEAAIPESGTTYLIQVNSGTLTLSDCGGSNSGKLLGTANVTAKGSMTQYGGTISVPAGVGVQVDATRSDSGVFNLYGGVIDTCAAGVNSDGIFNMYGGTISKCNRQSEFDKGVAGNGTMYLYGGVIENCTTGVTIYSSLNFYGGTIRNCTTGVGGNVQNLNLYDGAVINGCGTGVNTNNGVIWMYGGTIQNCTEYGVLNYRRVSMYGGAITRNKCGAMASSYGGVIIFSGKPKISGNTAANLVLLRNDAGSGGVKSNIEPTPGNASGRSRVGVYKEGLEDGADIRVRVIGNTSDLTSVTKYGETKTYNDTKINVADWNISTDCVSDVSRYITSDDTTHIIVFDAATKVLRSVAKSGYSNTTNLCLLRYDANGGTGSMDVTWSKTQDVGGVTYGRFTDQVNGGKLHKNTFTAPEGCTFLGWNTEKDGTGIPYADEAAFNLKADDANPVTLYAQWVNPEQDITVTVIPAGGNCETESIKVRYGQPYGTLPTVTFPGFELTGWRIIVRTMGQEVEGKEIDSSTIVTEGKAHTIKAQWKPKELTVTLDPGEGATCSVSSLRYKTNEAYANGIQVMPVRKGYTFLGWYTEKEGGEKVKTSDGMKSYDDHTLYAHWKDSTISVTFDTNGRGVVPQAQTVLQGETVTRPTNPTAQGYDFKGWYTEAACENEWDFDTNTVTDSMTLYAKWEAQTYTLTFDTNGGGAVDPESIQVTYDGTYGELPTPTRDGYLFLGWYTAPNHGGMVKSGEKVDLTENGKLYAHWTIPTPTVTAGENLSLIYGYKDGSISVTAEAAEGSVISAYQWYSCDENGENAAAIEGAADASYAVGIGKSTGTYYYFCEVTAKHSENDDTATTCSGVITVAVGRTIRNAAVTMSDYVYGKTPAMPTVTGNNENGEVTFYYTTENVSEGGTAWDVQNPPALTVGVYYLYATIDATVNYSEFTTPAVRFEVTKADPEVIWPTVSGAVYVNDAELGNDCLTGGTGAGTFSITGAKTWSESGEQAMEVTFRPTDDANYNVLIRDVTVTVSKRVVEHVTTDLPAVTSKDYGTALAELGLPDKVTILVSGEKTFTLPVTWSGYNPNTLEEQTLTGALDLTAISAEVEQPETAVTAAVSVTLNQLTPGGVIWEAKTATYTGNPISHTIETLPAGTASVTYTYKGTGDTDYAAGENAPTHAGTYSVTARFTMKEGYAQLTDAASVLTIEKADASLTPPKMVEGLVYTGKSQTLITAGESADGEMQYRLEGGEYGPALPAAAAAGTYRIFYKVVGDKDHNDSAEGSLTVTIRRKPIALPAEDTTEFVYDGKAQTYQVEESDDYTVSGTEQTDAGTHFVKLALTDPDNTMWKENQSSEEQTFDFVIRKAELTLKVADKSAYVGGNAPSLSDPKQGKDYTVTGLMEGDEHALLIGPTLSYDPAEPDMTKPGEAVINAANASAGNNYTIVYEPGKLTVRYYPATLYTPSVAPAENGTVTVSPMSAGKGATVTVTPKPEEGYRLASVTVTDRNGNEIPVTKQDGTYTFIQPDAPVTVTAHFAKAEEAPVFRDVPVDAYYTEAVRWAVENGITDGVGNELFAPGRPCTRAQIVTFLWRAAGSPEPKSTVSFTDVPADSYYAKAVVWAVENGIAFGVGDDAFDPDETCTRAQSAAFLFRACGSGTEGEVPFRDVAAGSYYAEAVKWAAESGITDGVGDGLFAPDLGCTRGQIVTFLYRMYQKAQ